MDEKLCFFTGRLVATRTCCLSEIVSAQSIDRKEAAQRLAAAQTIALTSHVRPDGDALGSMLGLGLTLEAQGKTVHYFHREGVPSSLVFLEGKEKRIKEKLSQAEGSPKFDLFVALDTANFDRLACDPSEFGDTEVLVIDHHVTNELYGDFALVDSQSPATAQLVWEIAQAGGWDIPKEALSPLYVGVSTDTGSFRYANTSPRTHEMAGNLVARGLDVAEVNRLTYSNYPQRRIELLRALLGTLRIEAGGVFASWTLTLEKKEELNYQPGDSEGLIDLIRGIDSVQVCVFFEEGEDGAIRVSCRSKDARYNVSQLCQAFGGGGHILAAGARLDGSLVDARKKLIAEFDKQFA